MRWSLLGQPDKTLTPDSAEIFHGLGVETVAERKRLFHRAEQLNYLDLGTCDKILGELAFHDETELILGVGSQDLEPRVGRIESQARRVDPETRNTARVACSSHRAHCSGVALELALSLDPHGPIPIEEPKFSIVVRRRRVTRCVQLRDF